MLFAVVVQSGIIMFVFIQLGRETERLVARQTHRQTESVRRFAFNICYRDRETGQLL